MKISRFMKGLAFAAGGAFAVALVVGSGGLAAPLIVAGAVGGGLFGNKIVDKISSIGPIARRLEARRVRKAAEKARFDEIKQLAKQKKLGAKLNAKHERKQARDDLYKQKMDAKAAVLTKKLDARVERYAQKTEARADAFKTRLKDKFDPVAAIKKQDGARILPDFAAKVLPVGRGRIQKAAAAKAPSA